MLLAICTQKAHKYTFVTTEPQQKVSIKESLGPKWKEIQNGKKIILFDMDETLIHAVRHLGSSSEGSYPEQYSV